MKESSAQISMLREKSLMPLFLQEEWLVGRLLLAEILGQTDPVGAKTPIFNQYSLVAPQP